jgi:hypothetical protein
VISKAPPTLTLHDRCDRCGSQALLAVANENGELLFCRHHANAHLDVLIAQEWEITIDQRDMWE